MLDRAGSAQMGTKWVQNPRQFGQQADVVRRAPAAVGRCERRRRGQQCARALGNHFCWSIQERIGLEWVMTVPSASFNAGSFFVPVASRSLSREPFAGRDRTAVAGDHLAVVDVGGAKRFLHTATAMEPRAAVVAVSKRKAWVFRPSSSSGSWAQETISFLLRGSRRVRKLRRRRTRE